MQTIDGVWSGRTRTSIRTCGPHFDLLSWLRHFLDGPVAALLGGLGYGGWAVFVNWRMGVSAWRSGGIHAILSIAITLSSVRGMRLVFATTAPSLGAALRASVAVLVSTYGVLILVHHWIGTQHIAATLAPGLAPTIGFDLFFAYLLAREAGVAMPKF